MPEVITSLSNPRIKEAVALRKNPSAQAFVVEGFHLVETAREKGLLDRVFACEDPIFPDVETWIVPKAAIEKMASSKTPEPILGIAHLPEDKKELGNKVLLLDRLQDPGNVGTLIRTALAFGFEDIVFAPGTCSPMNSKSIAASQGALFGVSLHFPADVLQFCKKAQKEGFLVVGSALKNAISLDDFPQEKGEKMILVVGNEGKGMSKSLQAVCDYLVRIPMGNIDSLNAAIAGGILLERFSIFH